CSSDLIASSVTLVHRRARFRAAESTVRQAYAEGVRVITDAEVTALRGDATGGLAEVDVRLKSGERLSLPAQTVVAALGFTADLGPLESWGLEIERRTIRVDTTMATSRERGHAAGDGGSYPGKVRPIATGFGEAATAVNNIDVDLAPRAK